MGRWRGKTAERGYGSDHATLRKALLARWRPGDPCARCGQPMWGPADRIHLGHTEDRTGYTGLEHADCNTREGARRGNAARQFTPAAAGSNVICRGCGQPYHYAARTCEMCGAHYHPSYGQQRTCGRACGSALQRRNRGPRQPPHRCGGCGEFTSNYRWCDQCRCGTVNAKDRRCGNVANVTGQCNYHAATTASSRQW